MTMIMIIMELVLHHHQLILIRVMVVIVILLLLPPLPLLPLLAQDRHTEFDRASRILVRPDQAISGMPGHGLGPGDGARLQLWHGPILAGLPRWCLDGNPAGLTAAALPFRHVI